MPAGADEWEEFLAERDRRYSERFEAQEKAVAAALAAQEKATAAAFAAASQATAAAFAAASQADAKADAAQEKRNESQNEFRGQLADQAATLMPRSVADVEFKAIRAEMAVEFKALREKIDALENWRSKATGAAVVLVLIAGVVGGAVVKAFGG